MSLKKSLTLWHIHACYGYTRKRARESTYKECNVDNVSKPIPCSLPDPTLVLWPLLSAMSLEEAPEDNTYRKGFTFTVVTRDSQQQPPPVGPDRGRPRR